METWTGFWEIVNEEGLTLALDRLMEDFFFFLLFFFLPQATCTLNATIDFVIECMRVLGHSNPLDY